MEMHLDPDGTRLKEKDPRSIGNCESTDYVCHMSCGDIYAEALFFTSFNCKRYFSVRNEMI